MPQAPSARPLPLFYRRPRALQAELHAGLSLKRAASYRFAAKVAAIPLTGSELFHAQRDYPIVFTNEPVPMPVAVVALKDQDNLFVERDGSWRRGSYVPGYVRRYPFLFAEQPETGQLTLCIDEDSDLIETGVDNAFFLAGQTTETTKKALEFCLAYQREYEATRELARTLVQVELLALRDAKVQITTRETVTLQGFKMIDEEKFNQLPSDTFLEWRAKGWIAQIYAHLLSLGSWDRLVAIARESLDSANSAP